MELENLRSEEQSSPSLRTKYDQAIDLVRGSLMEFPWNDQHCYGRWLAQTWYFVSVSTRLLALAGGRMTREQQAYHWRFLEHVREERGHENMLLSDLKNVGFRITDFPELPVTAAFYQTQFYWIEHINPLAFYGYIIFLEGLGAQVGDHIYSKVNAAFGEKAGVFLKVHGEEDKDHIETAFEYLIKLPHADQAHIAENLRIASGLYAEIISQCRSNTQFLTNPHSAA